MSADSCAVCGSKSLQLRATVNCADGQIIAIYRCRPQRHIAFVPIAKATFECQKSMTARRQKRAH